MWDVPRLLIGRSDISRSVIGRSDVPRSVFGRSDVPRSVIGRSDVPRSVIGQSHNSVLTIFLLPIHVFHLVLESCFSKIIPESATRSAEFQHHSYCVLPLAASAMERLRDTSLQPLMTSLLLTSLVFSGVVSQASGEPAVCGRSCCSVLPSCADARRVDCDCLGLPQVSLLVSYA